MSALSSLTYPFEFIGASTIGADNFQLDTLIYRFRSAKSAHEYEVHVERYVQHLCCLKFFDTSSQRRFGRFSQLSETFEPRVIFYTVAKIAFDVLQRDSAASFCFIGAADERDSTGSNTRRYRVYKAFLRHLGLDEQFDTAFIDNYSMVILVNRRSVSDFDSYVESILQFV